VFRRVKGVAMDVDGVLTDGTFWWGSAGEEMKRFCFADVTGIGLARGAGLPIALISGESSASGKSLVQRYADKLGIGHVYAGCHDKAAALREFAAAHSLDLDEVCFIGDDVIDIPAMSAAGVAVAPSDAHPAALARAAYVTTAPGGRGAVREVLDFIVGQRDMPG
jgi:3-deoxy-D-manno-octulosonate 8-phosphate phosphatase (KDO 8-P phosphatase)